MSGAWRLRGYVVEELLGRGSAGEVWRGRVAASSEPVALKRISTTDPQAAGRARVEAALLTELDHPHLVRLHTLIPTGDASVLVLDLADGGSLAQLLDARGRLAPGEVITAVAPVGAALAYLHRNGVVHGDVSAANILFLADGAPLLSDVGVARLTGDVSDVHSTPAYIDPAVAAGCVPGPQSDVFMLAAVALHALTGQPPWPAATAPAALALAATGRLDDVGARLAAAGVSEAMSAVLCRALSVDPHRRGTAADLALDLRHSGEPLAVELTAGRPRPRVEPPVGPRHAARPARVGRVRARGRGFAGLVDSSDDYAGPRAGHPREEPVLPPGDAARPAFERPTPAASNRPPGGAPPPTRLVGPRPRPVIPRPAARRFGTRRLRLLAAAGLAAVLATGAGALWLATASPPRRAAVAQPAAAPGRASGPATRVAPAAPTSRPAASLPASSAAPRTARRTTTARDADPHAVHAALDRLDATRARAFATRNAALLARVYLPGYLLHADTALLIRLVPAGCGLTGARTTYSALHVSRHSGRIAVTTTASLAPSRLVCGGRVTGVAPRAGPATVRLELADTRAGPRIATQRVS